ncbi:hypothetical protein RhiirA1_463801 [Rhizophagus irregularis]|uniref:Uncharacterized protein n=3 Tax=Rhizophagus irregularis TaxID=588596 RepID=A0A2N0RJC0_9GLOM|nr:hypothetical protein RhiirA1_463801 [Rhizophagus irregularis]
MASEPLISTSKIQTDISESFQFEKYIMQVETEPPLICPSYNVVIIKLTREEVILTSGKYHLQKNNEGLMTSLGLVEGGFRVGQGSQLNSLKVTYFLERRKSRGMCNLDWYSTCKVQEELPEKWHVKVY